MKNLKIKSHHHSLSSAVEAANFDIAYNPECARRTIRDIDLNCTKAMVMEDGSIYYVYEADIDLLHKFSPFCAVLSDEPFSIAFICGSILSISEPLVKKSKAGRAWFKANTMGALAA
tara:strand:+ start:2401 stop:2751 length:351 start_codon:yes stop_codon:yes gene_type:complete